MIRINLESLYINSWMNIFVIALQKNVVIIGNGPLVLALFNTMLYSMHIKNLRK
jgi:hypothetical protein